MTFGIKNIEISRIKQLQKTFLAVHDDDVGQTLRNQLRQEYKYKLDKWLRSALIFLQLEILYLKYLRSILSSFFCFLYSIWNNNTPYNWFVLCLCDEYRWLLTAFWFNCATKNLFCVLSSVGTVGILGFSFLAKRIT